MQKAVRRKITLKWKFYTWVYLNFIFNIYI